MAKTGLFTVAYALFIMCPTLAAETVRFVRFEGEPQTRQVPRQQGTIYLYLQTVAPGGKEPNADCSGEATVRITEFVSAAGRVLDIGFSVREDQTERPKRQVITLDGELPEVALSTGEIVGPGPYVGAVLLFCDKRLLDTSQLSVAPEASEPPQSLLTVTPSSLDLACSRWWLFTACKQEFTLYMTEESSKMAARNVRPQKFVLAQPDGGDSMSGGDICLKTEEEWELDKRLQGCEESTGWEVPERGSLELRGVANLPSRGAYQLRVRVTSPDDTSDSDSRTTMLNIKVRHALLWPLFPILGGFVLSKRKEAFTGAMYRKTVPWLSVITSLSSGLALYYYPNPVWGAFQDYMTLIVWALAVDLGAEKLLR